MLVVCEGRKTEKIYFLGFKRDLGALVELCVEGTGRDPVSLVQRAISRRDEARRYSKRRRDSFLTYDAIWCVCDVDQHTHLSEACARARQAEIEMAVSNPCFELWLLLHFSEQRSAVTTQNVTRELKKHIPNYDKSIEFDDLRASYDTAVERSTRLREQAALAGENGRNPSTDVDLLTESARRQGNRGRIS